MRQLIIKNILVFYIKQSDENTGDFFLNED